MYYSLLHFTFKSIELAVFAEDCNCNMYYVYMFARNKSKQIKLSEIPDPLIKTLFFFFKLSVQFFIFKPRIQQLQSI